MNLGQIGTNDFLSTEEQHVTSGELTESLGGTGVSRPISASEVASDALSVVGRLNTTYEAW
jgi:hypothetical protein